VGDYVKTVWQKAAGRIRDSLGEMAYETWIAPLNLVEIQGHTAVIEAPNQFFRDCISERYSELIEQVLAAELGGPVEAQITVAKAEEASKNSVLQGRIPLCNTQSPKLVKLAPRPNNTEQGPLNPELKPRFTFDQFVIGSSNQFAHAAAIAVSEKNTIRFSSTAASALAKRIWQVRSVIVSGVQAQVLAECCSCRRNPS